MFILSIYGVQDLDAIYPHSMFTNSDFTNSDNMINIQLYQEIPHLVLHPLTPVIVQPLLLIKITY